jgi:hypothetical protein
MNSIMKAWSSCPLHLTTQKLLWTKSKVAANGGISPVCFLAERTGDP